MFASYVQSIIWEGRERFTQKEESPKKMEKIKTFTIRGGRSRLTLSFSLQKMFFFFSSTFATFLFFSGIVNKRSQLAIDYFSLHHQCLNCELLLAFQDFLSDYISFPRSVFILVITQLFGCEGLKRPVNLNMILDISKGWISLT